MNGLGSAPDRFTSPLGESVAFNSVSLQLSADSELAAPVAGMTLVADGDGSGNHTLTFDTVAPGTCVTLTFDVVDLATGGVSTITITVCHLPLDVNQDGVVNISDITAWGIEYNDARRAALVNTNGDETGDIRDASSVGNNWRGDAPDATKPWQGESLP